MNVINLEGAPSEGSREDKEEGLELPTGEEMAALLERANEIYQDAREGALGLHYWNKNGYPQLKEEAKNNQDSEATKAAAKVIHELLGVSRAVKDLHSALNRHDALFREGQSDPEDQRRVA